MALRERTAAVAVLIGLAVVAADCGGMRTHMQRVPVTSDPIGAAVTVDGRPGGQTPVMIWLDRRAREHVIRIEAPGYDPAEVRTGRQTNGFVFLQDALLGAVVALPIAVYHALTEHNDRYGLAWAGLGVSFALLDVAMRTTKDVRPREIVVTLIKTRGEPVLRTVRVAVEDLRGPLRIRARRG